MGDAAGWSDGRSGYAQTVDLDASPHYASLSAIPLTMILPQFERNQPNA
eukprot:gene14541-10392_t